MKRKNTAAEPRPTPVAQLRREGRLARIAKALALGASVTDIAEAEGSSRAGRWTPPLYPNLLPSGFFRDVSGLGVSLDGPRQSHENVRQLFVRLRPDEDRRHRYVRYFAPLER